jgi:hypothetical protein
MEFGSALEGLFSRGIDAWKDIEVSKNYSANDPRPVTRDANGNIIAQGTSGVSYLSSITSNPVSVLGLVVVGGLLVWLIARKLR